VAYIFEMYLDVPANNFCWIIQSSDELDLMYMR
jgi:hypothetical protein